MCLSALLVALSVTGASAGAHMALPPDNLPGASITFCPCIGMPAGVQFVQCDASFSLAGTCALANLQDNALTQPDMGAGCKVHREPFSAACTNLTTGMPLPDGQAADWCLSPWCYVDPCTCDAPDVEIGQASYYSRAGDSSGVWMAYSYSNCGGQDTWSSSSDSSLSDEDQAWRTQNCHMECNMMKAYFQQNDCCGTPARRIPFPVYPFSPAADAYEAMNR